MRSPVDELKERERMRSKSRHVIEENDEIRLLLAEIEELLNEKSSHSHAAANLADILPFEGSSQT